MCGIFGIVSNSRIDPAEFRALGQLSTARGNLGFGGLVVNRQGCDVYRYPIPFDAMKVPLQDAIIALGHVRAPTGGQSSNIAEVHPFETRDLLLAHNGLLLNHTDFPQWRIDPAQNVDSQVIIGGIQRHLDDGLPLAEAIKQTVEALDGQQACWLWHKPTSQIYLWRVMAPNYVSVHAAQDHHPQRLIFSSIKGPLAQNLLDEGIIYRLDPAVLSLSEVANFAFYNPYRVS